MNAKVGDRIRLTHMPDDPNPIPDGSTGTVESVMTFEQGQSHWRDRSVQLGVRWDNGRTLQLISPPDEYVVVTPYDSARDLP